MAGVDIQIDVPQRKHLATVVRREHHSGRPAPALQPPSEAS
jgi:hypothetical protein